MSLAEMWVSFLRNRVYLGDTLEWQFGDGMNFFCFKYRDISTQHRRASGFGRTDREPGIKTSGQDSLRLKV